MSDVQVSDGDKLLAELKRSWLDRPMRYSLENIDAHDRFLIDGWEYVVTRADFGRDTVVVNFEREDVYLDRLTIDDNVVFSDGESK